LDVANIRVAYYRRRIDATSRWIIAICGFQRPIELVPRDASANERLEKNALLSPERRLQRVLKASSSV